AAWAQAAAGWLADRLRETVSARGSAVFAGSGGSTPGPIYAALGAAPLDWSRVVVTLVDERFVPEQSPDSTAGLLHRTVLAGPAAAARFVGLFTGARPPAAAAGGATAILAAAAGVRLDAALVGMGEDGHILSMFPGSPALPALLDASRRAACLAVPAGLDGRP